jgi:light-regulated signal transduction histidine kinase (bacteriophytochrome)
VVVEAEPAGEDPADAALAIETSTRELATLRSVAGLATSAALAVARLTGYDRVMVYRFAADGSGTVIAEQLAAGQTSYLGLRYPAGDIPPQARALYLRNPTRVIVDAHDEGLPVHTLHGRPLDLSLAVLRSVSPVHLHYMRNMGTAASMSISLIVDGRLWGLIACHHRQALRPALACRAMSELLGRLYSLALARAERQPLEADIKTLLMTAPGVDPLVDPDASDTLRGTACASIARLMEISGVATCIEGRVATWGQAPPHAKVEGLVDALGGSAEQRVVAVESLAAVLPSLDNLAPGVSGLLGLSLGAPGRDWVLLLRDEVLRHVSWAGDPSKPLQRQPNGRLSPRASFAAWRTAVHRHCEPWTTADIELAEVMRTRLIEARAARREQRAVEDTRRAAQQQALLVKELNHRVRNMLGVIKGLVEQTARSATSVEDLTARLHDRVHALSRAYTRIEKAHWQPTPLVDLVREEAGAFAEPAQVEVVGEAVQLEPQAYLSFALVIHELATNARKYGALSVPGGRLTVSWRVSPKGTLEIDWLERQGPRVEPPTRRGFGTRVIRQALEHQLRGHASLSFEPDGLHARLSTLRGFVRPANAAQGVVASACALESAAGAGLPRPSAVHGTVLILEDDLVMAIMAESMLEQLGCAQVLTAGTADHALLLLREQRVDLALIDVNLGDHSSEGVARRLAELGIPTLVTTGYSETDSVPEPLRQLPRLCKPFTQGDLADALDGLAA